MDLQGRNETTVKVEVKWMNVMNVICRNECDLQKWTWFAEMNVVCRKRTWRAELDIVCINEHARLLDKQEPVILPNENQTDWSRIVCLIIIGENCRLSLPRRNKNIWCFCFSISTYQVLDPTANEQVIFRRGGSTIDSCSSLQFRLQHVALSLSR